MGGGIVGAAPETGQKEEEAAVTGRAKVGGMGCPCSGGLDRPRVGKARLFGALDGSSDDANEEDDVDVDDVGDGIPCT